MASLSSAPPADKRSLQPDSALNIVSCKDGRQMLTIAKVSRKDAGLYECAAANTLGTAISSCTLAVARKDAGGTSGDRACTRRWGSPALAAGGWLWQEGHAWALLLAWWHSPGAGDAPGQGTRSLLSTWGFRGGHAAVAQASPRGSQPALSVHRQGSLGGRAPRRSPRSTRTRCWCSGSPQRAKPPAPTRWSAGWRVRGQ